MPYQLLFRLLAFLLAVSLSHPLAHFLPRPPSHLLSDNDICNAVSYPVQTSCFDSQPLHDPRFQGSSSTQCRSHCRYSEFSDFRVFHFDQACPYCQENELFEYIYADNSGNYHICVPRSVCIKNCGLEREGCVYTGSCGSQICLESSASDNNPARVVRYTHRGPGTIFEVDSNVNETQGNVTTDTSNPNSLSSLFTSGADLCPTRNASFALTFSCFDQPLLGDGRGKSTTLDGQCRALCKYANYSEFEVIRRPTSCGFCNTAEADAFFTDDPGEDKRICVPRETCIEKCGAEGYGCVYTGSCESRICFSGINSKKPAVFTRLSDDGAVNEISVDNSGDPVDADPAVFTRFGEGGNATASSEEVGLTPEPPTTIPTAESATTSAPTATPSTPTATPSAPTATLSTPTATPSAPTATLSTPTATPSAPTATLSTPTATPSAPTATPLADDGASQPPAASPSPTGTTGSATSPPDNGEAIPPATQNSESRKSSIWIWLGPTIGGIALGVILIVAIICVMVRRKENQAAGPPPTAPLGGMGGSTVPVATALPPGGPNPAMAGAAPLFTPTPVGYYEADSSLQYVAEY